METRQKVWMGIGLYQHYVDYFRRYVEEVSKFDEFKVILADEIQRYNVSLGYGRERKQIKQELEEKGSELERTIDGFELENWSSISKEGRYQQILDAVNQLYLQEEVFNRQVKKITARKTKTERTAPGIDTLAGYTLEELSSIYFFAERGYVKAGHQGERDYDKLAVKTLRKYPEKLQLQIGPEDLKFIYLDKELKKSETS